MRLAPALAIACSIVPGLARAAVVSYSAPAFGAESAVENTIPAFDPSLGTLEGAQFRLTGTLSDSFAGRLRYSGGPTGSGDVYTLAVVPRVILGEFADLPFGQPLAHDTMKIAMDGFGGDYWGGYSIKFDFIHKFYPEMFYHIPHGDIIYTLSANTYIPDYSFHPYDGVFRPEFRGTATMTYTHSLVGVPEPSSLALLALGLAGCLAVSARRGAGVVARRRPSVSALALAGLMAPVAARAAVVSYSAPAFGMEAGVLNIIADFDPALGTLERVHMRLTGTVSDHIAGAIRQPHHSSDDDDGGKLDPEVSAVLTTGVPYVFFHPGRGYSFHGKPVTFYLTNVCRSFYGGYSADFDSMIELPAEIFGRNTGLPPYFFGDAPDGGKTYALGAGTASSGVPFPTW